MGKVIENVWRSGGRLEAWTDYFDFDRWMNAFRDAGLSPEFYAHRERGKDEILPWDVVDVGVRKDHLWREREYSRCDEKHITDCRMQCAGCGAKALSGGRCDG